MAYTICWEWLCIPSSPCRFSPIENHVLMLKHLLIPLVLVSMPLSGSGQSSSTLSEIDLSVISQVNQGNSYITSPTDIGNIEQLWFEANLIPNFYLRESKNSRLMGVLTPQIIIRMYQEESFPVRTPSYLPQLTLYYFFKKKENLQTSSFYGRIGHHSNGQEGAFYSDEEEINLKSGNFLTNFLELGYIKTNINNRFNAYQFFKTSLEYHPKRLGDTNLHGIYSRYRWHGAFSIFRLPKNNEKQPFSKRPTRSLKGEATWMFGNYNDLNTLSPERFNLKLTFYYHPKFLEDIGFFTQFYHGSDYYNIYFNHRLNILRFGIMTEKLTF